MLPVDHQKLAGPDSALKVYFCGMIGSGKTTIGTALAKELGLPYYDLDREMDRILGYSFHELVQKEGWLAFRELEYRICKQFARLERGVVGLGGGTVRYQWNMDVLRGSGIIVLLTAPPEVLIERVRAADRPRVNANVSLEEDIRTLWDTHKDKYLRAADFCYPSHKHGLAREVDELKAMILSRSRLRRS